MEQYLDILSKAGSVQEAILTKLDINSLNELSSGETLIGQMIRSDYMLERLSKLHNLPPAEDYEQFQSLAEMHPQALLKYSARYGYFEVIESRLQKIDPNWDWDSILNSAVKSGSLEIVDLLITKVRYVFDSTSLEEAFWRAVWYGHLEILRYFYILDPNLLAQSSEQSVEQAAERGHTNIIIFLAQEGYYDQYCALEAATISGNKKMVKFLLSAGLANKNLGDIISALECAVINSMIEVAEILVDELIRLNMIGVEIKDLEDSLERVEDLGAKAELAKIISNLKSHTSTCS